MTELEMEIGRTLGSSTFFIYQTVKHNPGLTRTKIEIETGLSTYCVWKCLRDLRDNNIVTCNTKIAGNRKEYTNYKITEDKSSWKLH